MIISSILNAIGNTPLVRLNSFSRKNKAIIYGKAEFLNPMGSVKDRTALAMIEDAERSGKLHSGMTIVEATSGNTGVGLTMVSVVKGYDVRIVMEEIDIVESIYKIIKIFGAKIIKTNSFKEAVELTEFFAMEDPQKYFVPHQFKNPANPQIHVETTAQEIIRHVGSKIKAFVSTVGSGGTFTGIGYALKKYNSNIEMVLVEPDTVQLFSGGFVSCSEIHGIGPTFISEFFDKNLIDTIIQVNAHDAHTTAYEIARKEGMLCGPSAGAAVYAATQIANKYGKDDIVVAMLPDRGERYFAENVFPI